MLRISPIFIFLFVAAAVIAAFGIHKYMRQTQVSAQQSFSSEAPPGSSEKIENIPGEWAPKNKDQASCASWSDDGVCLLVGEE